MPLFEYKCQDCNSIDEHLEAAKDASSHKCSKCGSNNTRRVFGAFSASVAKESSQSCATGSSCPTGTCPFARG